MQGKGSINVLLVVTAIIISILKCCDAAHVHHKHGDVLGRVMRKSRSGFGSSLSPSAAHHDPGGKSIPASDPVSSLVNPSPTCHETECESLESTLKPEKPSHVVPEARIVTHGRSILHPTNTGVQAISLPKPLQERLSLLQHPTTAALAPSSLSHPLVPRQDDSYQSFVLGQFVKPISSSTTSSAPAASICPASNGTTYKSSANVEYQVLCDIDFRDNDFPFQLVNSFEACVTKCDQYNSDHNNVQCVAALFVPSRENYDNDCYLKSSIANPISSGLGIQGAIRLSGTLQASPSSSLSKHVTSSTSASAPSRSTKTKSNPSTSTAAAKSSSKGSTAATLSPTQTSSPGGSSPGVTYASGNTVIVPKIASSHLHGPTVNNPTKQYIKIQNPPVIQLADSLLTTGVNGDLTTGYDLAPNTGVLDVNITTQPYLSPLSQTPHLSRDGGRGGSINGQHMFIFCDTGSYSPPSATANGNFLGFVSSSCAVDVGMNGLNGKPLSLQDGIGEWSDDTGRQRGFAPLTEGELAYNLAKQGNGQRYAVWPESSIIPLDATTGIIYAPIVYDDVNRATRAAVFTYAGATLLTITAGGKGGPVAERTVDRIFDQNEIEWGCAGGIRSWGSSGIGGDDGLVYVFGNIAGGILAGRTAPDQVANRGSYEFWDGDSWTTKMPTTSSTAFFIQGPLMDIDVFYSPRHLTFIIVYLTIYADSTFYYRYLEADQGILPPFAPGGDSTADYVENIFKYQWSEEKILYRAATGLSGSYVYAGGVHLGYYGANDISNGGSRMLISWTAPTGQDPASLVSEYQLITAEMDWA